MLRKAILTYKSFGLPPIILIRRAFKKLLEKSSLPFLKKKIIAGNYILPPPNLSLKSGLVGKINEVEIDEEQRELLTQYYLSHQFNYLASGWKFQGYAKSHTIQDLVKRYVPNTFHQKANFLIKHLSKSYIPIDWQQCFSSSHRYDSTKVFFEQKSAKGADIKEPWELSRLQHLPRLLLFSFIEGAPKKALIKEVKDQITDFIIFNPIGFGANWVSPMDVAIRIANLSICFELFIQLGVKLGEFEQILANHIYEGAYFIEKNLENKQGRTGNHYIFNLLGLQLAGTYLLGTDEAKGWRLFAIQEIQKEFDKQFYDDGLNTEASTAYHFLTSEALLISLFFMNEVEQQSFIQKQPEKVKNWINSFSYLIKPNGKIPQIGDNDSGTLYSLMPNGRIITKPVFKEGRIKPKEICCISDKLFWEEGLKKSNIQHLVLALSGNNQIRSIENQLFGSLALKNLKQNNPSALPKSQKLKNLSYKKEKTILFQDHYNDNVNTDGSWKIFDQFGLAVFKTENLFVAISFSTEKKKNHGWRHQHNDKLGLELYIGDKDVLVDPGTFVYTRSKKWRNHFRSTQNHNIPFVEGMEQNRFLDTKQGIFNMMRDTKTKLISCIDHEITVQLKYRKVIQTRTIKITPKGIEIIDQSSHPFKQLFNPSPVYSPSYGELIENPFPTL